MRTFAKPHWLAILLGSLHLALVATVLAIELLGAWNDMNATFLVRMLFIWIDYPLVLLWMRIAPDVSDLVAIISLGALGTIAWSLAGLALQAAWRNRPRRFSLRSLLIVTALVAVVVAAIVAVTQ
jgi:hypothetical protein